MSTPELTLDGAVATITLRRPEQANRLGPDDLAVVAEHIATVNAAPDILVLRIVGTGKYFCSGYDIGRIGAAREVSFETVVNALEEARPVTIAVLHGGVYGGATDLALSCDFRVGATGIDMFMPAARLGLHYYQRGLERYVARVGMNNTKRLFLTAERIDAQEMKSIGYLTHLVAPEALQQTVDSLVATLCAMAPLALLGMKKNITRIGRGALDVADLNADIARAGASADLQEGRQAWLDKRTPRFTGR